MFEAGMGGVVGQMTAMETATNKCVGGSIAEQVGQAMEVSRALRERLCHLNVALIGPQLVAPTPESDLKRRVEPCLASALAEILGTISESMVILTQIETALGGR